MACLHPRHGRLDAERIARRPWRADEALFPGESVMSRRAHRLAVVWIVVLTGGTAQAASFDCSKARAAPERMICGDARLSELDDQLAAAYRSAVQAAPSSDRLRIEQQQWIAERNRCMTVDCLAGEYRARTAALAAGAPSQAQAATSAQRWDTGDRATRSVLDHITFSPTRITFAQGTSLDIERLGTGRVTDDLAGSSDAIVQADIYRVTRPSSPLLDNGRDHLCAKPITFVAIWEPEVERQLGFGPNREIEYYTDPAAPTPRTPRCAVSTFDAPK